MDWYLRARENIHKRDPREFVVDGTRFVTRRAIARVLVSLLTEVDTNPDQELRYGSMSSTTIDSGSGELPGPYRERIGTYKNPPAYVREFENVRLVGTYALGLTSPKSVITETAGGNIHLFWPTLSGMIKKDGLRDTFKALRDQIEPTEEYDYAVSLVSFNVENYYHWVIEHLPQLRGVEHYAAQEGVSPVLILPQNPPDWMIESLAVCGYDEGDWVEWTGEPTQVNHLVVPEHPFRSMEIDFPPAIENCQWLRHRATSNVDLDSIDDLNLSPYVYISREDADSRRVVDRDELLAELHPLGFESYVLSDLTFRQQVALFDQAEVIVAPHGAGATNMVFATDGTFVELIHSGNVRGAHYFQLAHECGHEYICIQCESVGADMKADIKKLIDHTVSEKGARSSVDWRN